MTLITARLYATRAKQKIVIEGSFELNPLFQQDVDSGRIVSRRWVIGMAVLIALVSVLWYLTRDAGWPQAYLFVVGGMLFLQLAVQTRHLRNWFLFTTALGEDGIRGRIEYPRSVVLSQSAFEFLVFGALYAVAYLATQSVLLLGGTVTCLGIATKQYLLRRQLRRKVGAAQQGLS
jgi:hypothetical protein